MRDENDAYDTFALHEIKIRLKDNGSKTITHKPRQRGYEYINGERILSKKWRISIGQEIEYDTNVHGNRQYSLDIKGKLKI